MTEKVTDVPKQQYNKKKNVVGLKLWVPFHKTVIDCDERVLYEAMNSWDVVNPTKCSHPLKYR